MMLLLWQSRAGERSTKASSSPCINGHLEIVKSIYENQPELSNWPRFEDGTKLMRKLLDPIKKEMLTYFRHERGMGLEPRDLEAPAFRRDLERVKIICELDLVVSTSFAVEIAAARGDYEMLRLLVTEDENLEYTTRAMDGAAEGGYLSTVRLQHDLVAPCTRPALDLASRNGHIEVVKFLSQHRQEGWSPYAVYWACVCGHGSIVQYLVASMKVPFDVDMCVAVSRAQGHHRIIEILEHYRTTIDQTRRIQQRRPRVLVQSDQSTLEVLVTDGLPTQVVYNEIKRQLWPAGGCQAPRRLRLQTISYLISIYETLFRI